MRDCYKGSQIPDRQKNLPQRETIIGGWRRVTKGPATKLIGNLLARPPAGAGITGSWTEKCLRERKIEFLRIRGDERDM